MKRINEKLINVYRVLSLIQQIFYRVLLLSDQFDLLFFLFVFFFSERIIEMTKEEKRKYSDRSGH